MVVPTVEYCRLEFSISLMYFALDTSESCMPRLPPRPATIKRESKESYRVSDTIPSAAKARSTMSYTSSRAKGKS